MGPCSINENVDKCSDAMRTAYSNMNGQRIFNKVNDNMQPTDKSCFADENSITK